MFVFILQDGLLVIGVYETRYAAEKAQDVYNNITYPGATAYISEYAVQKK